MERTEVESLHENEVHMDPGVQEPIKSSGPRHPSSPQRTLRPNNSTQGSTNVDNGYGLYNWTLSLIYCVRRNIEQPMEKFIKCQNMPRPHETPTQRIDG